MTMTRQCNDCGEAFETLTRKRLHECPTPTGGLEDWTEESLEGMDIDEMAERATDGLYRCVNCEMKAPDAELVETHVSEGGVYVAIEFDCPHCGWFNKNEAELS